MKRRAALAAIAAGPGLIGLNAFGNSEGEARKSSFALDGNQVRFFSKEIPERFTVLFVADTHLFRDDARGQPYQQYSGRMAKAYNQTRHFQTNEPTHPEECFEKTLAIAKAENAELVLLAGDIFSFPSEAAIEWVMDQLKSAGLPYLYVAGNHDWHYEGMEGSIAQLRETWIRKRLLPLYQQENPMMMARDLHNVRFVVLDNSNYQITREQLDFFQQAIASGKPVVLVLHIPIYAPERSLGFGCGHPEWGANSDKNYELERRERWPATGHTDITKAFYQAVLAAPNLLGVLAGHIHQQSLDVLNGLPQIVTHSNAHGGFLKVEFVPGE